jgi:two-component system chemotaxis response regulator CheB
VIKLLIVDDSPLMRRLFGAVFQTQGDFEVAFASDGREALEKLHEFRPDVITLDNYMPGMDGLTCLDKIMLERPCPVVMISSLTAGSADITLQAIQLGAVDFVAKPAGAMSLAIDEFAPQLVETIRVAAKARISRTARLTERVRLRANGIPRVLGHRPNAPALSPPSISPEKVASDSVVLVGCSTGGPPALDALLSRLPESFPWPILVAQHMPATFTCPLARRLDKLCALSVQEVTRSSPISPGNVYIAKGEADMIVASRPSGPIVMAAPASTEFRWHPSVTRLVTSAVQQLGARRLIGIMMTGMGNDGAAAMTDLSNQGGRTIAESEETAVVWGMPGELVKAGGAQIVAPLNEIATHLLAWSK